MYGFKGFDISGNSCFVDEQGNDIGYVQTDQGTIPAVRLDPSVYMSIDGKVYAMKKNNCSKYATDEWFSWARRKMVSFGWEPKF